MSVHEVIHEIQTHKKLLSDIKNQRREYEKLKNEALIQERKLNKEVQIVKQNNTYSESDNIKNKKEEYIRLGKRMLWKEQWLIEHIEYLKIKLGRAKENEIKKLYENTDTQLQQKAYGHTSLDFFRKVDQCQLAPEEKIFSSLSVRGFEASEEVVDAIIKFTYDHVKKIKAQSLYFTFTKHLVNSGCTWKGNFSTCISLDARWNNHLHGSCWNDGGLLKPNVKEDVWPGWSDAPDERWCKKYQELLSHDNLVVKHRQIKNTIHILSIIITFEN